MVAACVPDSRPHSHDHSIDVRRDQPLPRMTFAVCDNVDLTPRWALRLECFATCSESSPLSPGESTHGSCTVTLEPTRRSALHLENPIRSTAAVPARCSTATGGTRSQRSRPRPAIGVSIRRVFGVECLQGGDSHNGCCAPWRPWRHRWHRWRASTWHAILEQEGSVVSTT